MRVRLDPTPCRDGVVTVRFAGASWVTAVSMLEQGLSLFQHSEADSVTEACWTPNRFAYLDALGGINLAAKHRRRGVHYKLHYPELA